jgi:hypothetical protein
MRRYLFAFLALCSTSVAFAAEYAVEETDDELRIETSKLKAAISKQGYVTGIKRQTFVDKQTGASDLGYGLDIADWIMEPGGDEAYRDQLIAAGNKELVYETGNGYHGKTKKRAIEGPQICTQAKEMHPEVIRGKDFVAVKQTFQYKTAAPGKKTGSQWTQLTVFPTDTRYFFSMQQIDMVNASDAAFLRIDMPGHLKHTKGDTFSKIYLSYLGYLEPQEFFENFAPDEKFNYRRDDKQIPERMIRAYQIRHPETKQAGPWLAGMTLEPGVVSEAWCHERGYICFIEEFGERPVKPGDSFSAAFIVGYFDAVDEMNQVYDRYKGATKLTATKDGWTLEK